VNERLLPHPFSIGPAMNPDVPALPPDDFLDALAECERARARRQETATFGTEEEHREAIAAHARALDDVAGAAALFNARSRAVVANGFWHPDA
jgi:hypothetical protein